MSFESLIVDHDVATTRILGRDRVDRDEAFAAPKMFSAEPDNKVGCESLAPVANSTWSDIVSMPNVSREDILGFFESDSQFRM
jgi:hypothetical protein